jgi:uncharacterized membrane protein
MSIEFMLFLAVLALASIPVALIILFVKTGNLQREINNIRAQLTRILLEGAHEPSAPSTRTSDETVRQPADIQLARPVTAAPGPAVKVEVAKPQAENRQTQTVTPAWQPVQEDTPVSRFIDNIIALIKRYFTEGNLIVRLGIIVLFFGVAFLLKYASEHSMLPVEYRLLGTAAGGIALLLTGWRLRNRRSGYALALQGGGIGVLYLTLFAAFRIFHLLPAGWVFACLLVMVVLSAALAVLQDSKSLAVLAISGGFLAPVLTSTGEGSHIALFTYYAILNTGILTIAWFKSWRLLNLIGFMFTFVIGTAWGVTKYESSQFAGTETFLIIFFLFYVAIALLFARRQPPQLKGYVDGTMVFGVPIVAFSLQAGLVHEFEYGLAWSSFALGVFYIGLAWLHWLRGGQKLRLLSEAFLALGVVFATLTIPFALDGEWIATAWALEGAAIVWISIRQQKRLGVAFALALQLFAGCGFLLENPGRYTEWPVLNSVFMGAAFVALAGVLSSYFLYREYAGQKRWEAQLAVPFLIWGLLWWFANGLLEINVHVADRYQLSSIVIFVAGTAAILGLAEKQFSWTALKHTVTGLTAALVILLWISLVENSHPFQGGGYVSWSLMFAVFYGLLKFRDGIAASPVRSVPAAHAVGVWCVTLLLGVELHWQLLSYFDLSGAWLTVSTTVVVLLILNFILHFDRWPVSKHNVTYLSWGLAPLAGYLLLWSLFANIASSGQAAPIPYIPFINPLDIMQVLVLIGLLNWWRQYRQLENVYLNASQIAVALAGISFIWLNAVLLRSLHHWFDIPYEPEAMWNSLFVQACLSVFWTLLGLAIMVVASRKSWRRVWIAAAGLLGVVIAKLIFIDLAGRETLETIISFIVVGLLLLVVGYFSPLPPRQATTEGA